ncbi:HD-domain/PDEase-like protein [Backusella circina FSU 941]|nr:HD-domain/PDEase-like protein [Backusella circina FSU 941]
MINLVFGVRLSDLDLYAHVLSLFVNMNVHTTFKIDISQLLDFILDASTYYYSVPYHSLRHAADVVTVLYYLCQSHQVVKYLTELDKALLMVAALCHDIGHPGLTNSYQKHAKTHLAKQYGNNSILEKYSVDLTLLLLRKHCILLDHVALDRLKDLILSTDMTYHCELEVQVQSLIDKYGSVWRKYTTKHQPSNETVLLLSDRQCLSRILLHAADISNMVRPWPISKQWSDLILQEFYQQGDKEKNGKMPLSPGMDRETHSQRLISLKFSAMIENFYKLLADLFYSTHVLLDNLAYNRICWENIPCLDF